MGILITGGAGYIGSHTILSLLDKNYDTIISADCFLNSDNSVFDRIEQISGKRIKNYPIDLSDLAQAEQLFQEETIDTIIHFAALKSVPESTTDPLGYHRNNINSLLNLLLCMEKYGTKKIIFSSSCSIYGNPDQLPVTEETPFGKAESPYARTKQIGEFILQDFCKNQDKFKALSLRYFNPVGAHHSGLIGEQNSQRPNNLFPIITQTAAGIRECLTVYGKDYNTHDGTCIRDYIHVEDIAEAHVLAVDFLNTGQAPNYDAINLGSGTGTTVLEIINEFEKQTGLKLNYQIGARRAGDVEAIYADNRKAKKMLHWEAKKDLVSMINSAWKWQQHLSNQ
jgi:UDP-glucose 4-epimerase